MNRQNAYTKSNGGAPVWNLETLDGRNAFSDEEAGACKHRNEFACARLQL